MPPPPMVAPTETLADRPRKPLSGSRKLVLLFIFCFVNFLDVFNNSALYPALPTLESSLGITQSQSAWIISAFQLTFASFLLIGGRISDVYNPTFITGLFFLGIVSICAGFANNKIAIIVCRAILGITSAVSIPSALTLLVRVFPEPLEQARAIGIFGACGASGNVLGLFIGAVLVQYASYHWVFWFVAVIAIPVSLCCVYIISPEVAKGKDEPGARGARWKSLDFVGISILTAALILFIYAVTSGSADGWAAAGVLAPLIISILLIVGFFYWETLIPVEKAAIPPRTWFYRNFSVLFGSALYPLLWWSVIFIIFTALWQEIFHRTVISAAVHMLPLGVAALSMGFTGPLSRVFSSKWIILTGYSMVAAGTILLAVKGNRPENYWPYVFPAFLLGGGGALLAYSHTSIAMFQATPPSMAGTVGAIFNCALEFGSAIGVAVCNSIETSVENATRGGAQAYHGRAAVLWFLLGTTLVEIISLAYFYDRRTDPGGSPPIEDDGDGDRRGAGASSEGKPGEADGAGSETMTTKGGEANSLPV